MTESALQKQIAEAMHQMQVLAVAEYLRPMDLPIILNLSAQAVLDLRRKDKDFPKPVYIYGDVKGWLRSDIMSWIERRHQRLKAVA